MKLTELKPCQLCGGEAILYYRGLYSVACQKCGIRTLPCRDAQDASEIWNRRVNDE